MKENNQTSKIGRVEDHNDVFNLRAIFLDILSEIFCNLAIAFEKILTSHTLFTRSSTRRNDEFSILESNCWISGVGNFGTLESAVIDFSGNALKTRLIYIIQAKIRSELEQQSCLSHVRTDHSGSAYDGQFLICQKFHIEKLFKSKTISFYFLSQR